VRLLRGLGFAVGAFFVWLVFSVLGSFWFIGEYGVFTEVEYSIWLLPPWISIPMTGGFLAIFIGPIYYWIIEPIRSWRES